MLASDGMRSMKIASGSTQEEACFRALSSSVIVRSQWPEVLAELREVLASFASNDAAGASVIEASRIQGPFPCRLVVDGEHVADFDRPDLVVGQVVIHLTQRAAEQAREHVTLHAGAVSQGGAAAILVGSPDAGKSTLTAALVRDGFDYLSDELAPIGFADGLVHPFARPLVLDGRSAALVLGPALDAGMTNRRNHIGHDLIRPGSTGVAAPVRWLIAPVFTEGARARLEPMSAAEALHLVLGQSFNAFVHGNRAVQLLARTIERTESCYRIVFGDLEDALALVRRLTASS